MKINFNGHKAYSGDGLELPQGKAQVIDVSESKAKQLLTDFPEMFSKITGVKKPIKKKGKTK